MPVVTEAAGAEHSYPVAVVRTMLRAGVEQRSEELLLLHAHSGDQRALKVLSCSCKDRYRHGELVEHLPRRVYPGSSTAAAELAEYLPAAAEAGSAEADLTWPLASFSRSGGEISRLMAVYVLGGDKRRLVSETIEAGGGMPGSRSRWLTTGRWTRPSRCSRRGSNTRASSAARAPTCISPRCSLLRASVLLARHLPRERS